MHYIFMLQASGQNKAIMIFAAQQKQQYHEICMRQSSLHTTIMTKPQCIKNYHDFAAGAKTL